MIVASGIVAGTISAVLAHGGGRPGGWMGLAVSTVGAVSALLLWAGLGLLSAVLTRSPGGGVTVVAMAWVASYLLSFLDPGVRVWGLADLVAEPTVFDASRALTSPFLLVSGVGAEGAGAVKALFALTGTTVVAVAAATVRFVRQDIR